MKRLMLLALLAPALLGASAATLRVNNAANTAAEFNNVADALEAAEDGDVIILEPSSTSYGDFEVRKKVTIKGGGYLRDVNVGSYEGAAASKAEYVTVYAAGTTITGLLCREITLAEGANDVIITRNKVENILLGGTFGYNITEETAIAGTIIHQNWFRMISGPQYGAYATGAQITNNIITYNNGGIGRIQNSVIRYNTFGSSDHCAYDRINNSVFEYNMGGQPEKTYGDGNSFQNNHPGGDYKDYGGVSQWVTNVPDSKYKEVDATISSEHGAFAGETPYILSGIPAGPVIVDLTLPNAVEKGEDLKVSVTIGTQK